MPTRRRGRADASAHLRHRLAALGHDAAADDPRLAPAHLVRRGDAFPARTWSRSSGEHWRLLEHVRLPARVLAGSRDPSASTTGFQADYLARRGKARWAEKDPTYTLHPALHRRAVPRRAVRPPDARRPRRGGVSFRDRWGYRSAARAARGEWARYVPSRARARRTARPPSRYHELRYEAPRRRSGAEAAARSSTSWARPGIPRCCGSTRPSTTRPSATAGSPPTRRAAGGESAAIYRSRVGSGRRGARPVPARAAPPRSGALLGELGYLDGDRTVTHPAREPAVGYLHVGPEPAASGATGASCAEAARPVGRRGRRERRGGPRRAARGSCARPRGACAAPTSSTSSGSWPTGAPGLGGLPRLEVVRLSLRRADWW